MSIKPTKDDVGRRVKVAKVPGVLFTGKLTDHQPCGKCRGPCCWVHYDNERWPVATDPTMLEWADEQLL